MCTHRRQKSRHPLSILSLRLHALIEALLKKDKAFEIMQKQQAAAISCLTDRSSQALNTSSKALNTSFRIQRLKGNKTSHRNRPYHVSFSTYRISYKT